MANNLKLPLEVQETIHLFKKNNPVFKHADDTTVLMYALEYTNAQLAKEIKQQKLIH